MTGILQTAVASQCRGCSESLKICMYFTSTSTSTLWPGDPVPVLLSA